ncbi:MAG: hypothetical protein HQL06_00965 [Nitrospirae bacterium]|nr:hypothetical protein [Nitrospirota bacterium]
MTAAASRRASGVRVNDTEPGHMDARNKEKYITWNKEKTRWRVYIYWKGKRIQAGFYKDIKQAISARDLALMSLTTHETIHEVDPSLQDWHNDLDRRVDILQTRWQRYIENKKNKTSKTKIA